MLCIIYREKNVINQVKNNIFKFKLIKNFNVYLTYIYARSESDARVELKKEIGGSANQGSL